ncbi:MAG TPA: UPF0280 family protein [Methanomassiliicoccales archaeon]|jgi:hypothetical protein
MIVREHFELRETAVTIVADERYLPEAKRSIFESRQVLEQFIAKDPFFRSTLEPYREGKDAPPLIKRMCDAARATNVGPMAAVAGAVAEAAVNAMVEAGSPHALVDNGGDIAMILDREVDIGIYAGRSRFSGLAFRFEPVDHVMGICTSSATVGPSISFGVADAAIVISDNVSLADACATMLGNMVVSNDDALMADAVTRSMEVDGIIGCCAIAGDKIAMKGTIPRMVQAKGNFSKTSRILFGPVRDK